MSAERLSHALEEQAQRFSRALTRAGRGEVNGVHQARVASRRLREILPLTEIDEDTKPWRRLRRDVRRVTAALGLVREVDVTIGLLAAAAVRHRWQAAVVSLVRRVLDADRKERHSKLVETLDRVETRPLLQDLRKRAAAVAADAASSEWEKNLDKRRQSRASTLATTLRRLGTLYVPDRLHEVRLAAKKLRYTLETERAVRRSAVTADIRVLEAMQEHLGELHDLQILLDRLQAAVREPSASRDALTQLRRMCLEIEGECRVMHARVVGKASTWLRLADRRRKR